MARGTLAAVIGAIVALVGLAMPRPSGPASTTRLVPGVGASESLDGASPEADAPLLAVNADLTQYNHPEMLGFVDELSEAGITAVRQPVRWAEIERREGHHDWAGLDPVVDALAARGISVLLTIETSPDWSRHDASPAPHLWLCDDPAATDPALAHRAPPTDPADLAAFAAAVAERYGEDVWSIEVWPEPNLLPSWRAAGPDPEAYALLLGAAAKSIRAVNPDVLVVSGGLAPTTDVGVCFLSDVVFLDRLARTGALRDVDAVGIEPFGLRDGPHEGVADRENLNFARAEVLHGVLARRGLEIPVWAVAWGWNGLPADWAGGDSPWGDHDPETAARWTAEGYGRARRDWPWMGPMFVWHLQPAAEPGDPAWGFALIDAEGRTTPTGDAVAGLAAGDWPAPPPAAAGESGRMGVVAGLALAFALGAMLALAVRPRVAPTLHRWGARIGAYRTRWAAAVFVAALAVDLVGPWPVSLVAVGVMVVVAATHPRVVIGAVAASLPLFYAVALRLGPRPIGPVELLVLVAVAGRLLGSYAGDGLGREAAGLLGIVNPRAATRRLVTSLGASRLHWLDAAVVAIVVWAALSLTWSEHTAPALREWRTVILEPALFYAVLRSMADRRGAAQAAMDGLVLGGVVAAGWAVAGLGLHVGFGATGAVAAEGVLRANGPYNSPNNLALFLGRVVTVVVAFVAWDRSRRRRLYALAAAPIGLALLATFSRSALVAGLPAATLYLFGVALWRERRLTWRLVAVVVVSVTAAIAVLLPFVNTTRVRGTFDAQPGSTLFIRLRLWSSALEMARDHPLRGVGLDNFLYLYRDRYVRRDAVQERFLNHPHNVVLDWWTRLGLPGLVLFGAVCVGNATVGIRAIRAAPAARLALPVGALGMQVYALAHGSVDNVFFLVDLALVWWIAQAALLAAADD